MSIFMQAKSVRHHRNWFFDILSVGTTSARSIASISSKKWLKAWDGTMNNNNQRQRHHVILCGRMAEGLGRNGEDE